MNVLTFTPGLDSFISNWILTKHNKKFKRVYFHLRGAYNNREVSVLRSTYGMDYVDVNYDLSIENIEEKQTAHVPNRNLLLITMAQSLYGANKIYISGVKDDRTNDQGQSFYDNASSILSQCAGKQVTVESVLIEKEKYVWCKEYAQENLDTKMDLLTKTYSCFDPGSDPIEREQFVYEEHDKRFKIIGREVVRGCLKCPACYRRLAALTGANIYTTFYNHTLVSEYVNKIDPKTLPNRYVSAIKYLNFLEKVNDVKKTIQ